MTTLAPQIKLIVALLAARDVALEPVTHMLTEVFGSIDFLGNPHPFDATDYYENEMGPELLRTIVSFTGPHYADILAPAKLACIELEKGLSREDGSRTVNLDSGYLDHNKIVLASTKGAGQKIYIDNGIYADFVARYSLGSYKPFEWSFPDFKDGRYDPELAKLRALFLRQRTNEDSDE